MPPLFLSHNQQSKKSIGACTTASIKARSPKHSFAIHCNSCELGAAVTLSFHSLTQRCCHQLVHQQSVQRNDSDRDRVASDDVVWFVRFCRGSLHSSHSNESLRWLDKNNIDGTIPSEMSRLTNLRSLRMVEMNLTGSVPAGLMVKMGAPPHEYCALQQNGATETNCLNCATNPAPLCACQAAQLPRVRRPRQQQQQQSRQQRC